MSLNTAAGYLVGRVMTGWVCLGLTSRVSVTPPAYNRHYPKFSKISHIHNILQNLQDFAKPSEIMDKGTSDFVLSIFLLLCTLAIYRLFPWRKNWQIFEHTL